MEHTEEIVITVETEKTTYEALSPRERKIYDHAYWKGKEEGLGVRYDLFKGIFIVVAFAGILLLSLKCSH